MESKEVKKRKVRSPKLTLLERITKGLMTDPKEIKSNFKIKINGEKGRGVYLAIPLLKKNSFVLEYDGDLISEAEAINREKIYAHNNEGCFIMSFMFNGTKMAIDATRQFDSYTRLLNHSRHPNIRFYPPVLVELNSAPRIAAYALRDIKEGEEIVFDYGVRDGDIPWLRNTKAGYLPNIGSSSDEEEEDTPQITMRIPSPQKKALPPKTINEVPKLNDISCASQPTKPYTAHPLSGFTGLKRKVTQTSSTELNTRKRCGWRLTRILPGMNSFINCLENEGSPQIILRCIEEGPRKRHKQFEDETACFSISDDSTISKSELSIESQAVETIVSNECSLPISSHYSDKVLSWLPSVSENSSDMSICITKVESLCDTVPNNNEEAAKDTKLFVEIDSSSEDEKKAPSSNDTNITSGSNLETPQNIVKKTRRNLIKKLTPEIFVISDDESGSMPTRRPVGFSPPPSSQVQVAIIKPYVSTNQGVLLSVEDSPPHSHNSFVENPVIDLTMKLSTNEMDTLKTIFGCYVLTEKVTPEDIHHTIETNWSFFKGLIYRGISVEEIRSTVRNFFKANQP